MAKATAQPKPDRRRTPTRRADAPAADTTLSSDAIAARAFEYFQARGGRHGHDVEDWLQAERDLRTAGTPPLAS
jgi:hypothetical protein